MEAMIKWIGGATASILLGFTGAAVASGALAPTAQPTPQAAQAIPVDGQRFALPKTTAAPKPAASQFTVKRVLPITGPIKYGEWHWDDDGVPPGPVVITVDLEARVMSVFRGGYEIGAAAVLLGTDEYPTPLGTFPILAKQRHNKSEKYDDAPMPWSMFLTRDGVAIHGGSLIENGYASHGCIAGPDSFVAKVFAETEPGDKVVITRGVQLAMGQPIV
ncbi:L,D-transpeptidase family protein [Tsuneonella sp. HG249]